MHLINLTVASTPIKMKFVKPHEEEEIIQETLLAQNYIFLCL